MGAELMGMTGVRICYEHYIVSLGLVSINIKFRIEHTRAFICLIEIWIT